MKNIDNIIISIVLSIPVLFVICFFLWGNFFGPNRQELFMAESLKLSFAGSIDSIYYDTRNHNARTVLLNDGYKFALYDYWSSYLKVGDSVLKNKGTSKIIVHKKNNEIITLDYKNLEKMFTK